MLTNYSTYTMWAEVRDELGRTEEVDESAAVTDMVRFVRLHPTSIAQKVEVVVEHFRRNVAHHCRFGVVGTASPRSWYRCSAYSVLHWVFLS